VYANYPVTVVFRYSRSNAKLGVACGGDKVVLLLFDLLSTVCFAGAGASIALRKNSTFVGVFLSAMLASTGGGTAREVLLGSNTLFWLETPAYLLAVLSATQFAYILNNGNTLPKLFTKLAHSFATAVFIVVGVVAAIDASGNVLVCLSMGILTGIGGGFIRQVFFDRESLRFNLLNILSATCTALVSLILIPQNVNLLATIALLGFIHTCLTSKSASQVLSLRHYSTPAVLGIRR